jgi:hypothetical protein
MLVSTFESTMSIAYCSSRYKTLICENKFKIKFLSSHAKRVVHNFIAEKYRILFHVFCLTKHDFLLLTGGR